MAAHENQQVIGHAHQHFTRPVNLSLTHTNLIRTGAAQHANTMIRHLQNHFAEGAAHGEISWLLQVHRRHWPIANRNERDFSFFLFDEATEPKTSCRQRDKENHDQPITRA